MRASPWTTVAALWFASAACDSKNAYGPGKPYEGPPPQVDGVHPEKFDCEAFLPPSDVSAAAMAEVEFVKVEFTEPSPGTPKPCIYRLRSDETKAWWIHFDCRDVGQPDALLQMRQVAGLPDTKELPVGKRAVDHTKAQLIALDDDTACAIRVVGPDENSRAALARLVLARLNQQNQPRMPRGR